MTVGERVLSFGVGQNLHGVMTEPEPTRRLADAPAILFWNVGTHHHVGPHRVFVDLARRLSAVGFTTLRFDLSGLGDSAASRDDTRPDNERNAGDVVEAMQALKKQRGIRRFVLVGFCSSVDAAHAVGVSSEDVAGVVYLEGYQYKTRRYYLQYPTRLLDRNRWERLLRTKYPHLFGEQASLDDRSMEREQVFLRDYPTKTQLATDVRKMIARGLKLLWVYSGGDTDYSYHQQFFDFTGLQEFEGKIELDFYPHADHTFFLVAHREQVMTRVTNWLTREFGHGRKAAPAGSTADLAASTSTATP